MTLGHDFSERSEREIISKEKGAQNQRVTKAQKSNRISYTRQVFLLDTLKNVKFCP